VSYNKKIILIIFFLVTLVFVFVFYKILAIEFEYQPFHFDNIQCLIPSNLKPVPYSKNHWQGKNAFNSSQTHWIYIVRKKHRPPAPLENYFNKDDKIKSLIINNDLVFGIRAAGKSYRRYVYIFYYRNFAYWIESGTKSSSLLLIKEIADKILTSIKIDGKIPIATPDSILKKTTSFVTPRYSQSFTFFVFVLVGMLILTYGIVVVIFYFSNKEPKEFLEQPLQIFKGITFKVSFHPLGMQMYDGIIVSTRNELHLYTFRKPIVRINLEEINNINQVKIGRTFLLKQDYISFHFPEYKMVNIPGRKKSQRAKKITIYMDMNKIQQLLLETYFPLKSQLIQSQY
jgi:hypothetical protein